MRRIGCRAENPLAVPIAALALALVAVTGPDSALADAMDRGQAVVVGAGKAGRASSCLECHGVDGAGDASAGYPRLAGQFVFYLAKQLEDYAGPWRPDSVMTPIAQALTPAERQDVSTYYARVSAPWSEPAGGDGAVLRLGAAIARDGLPDRGIPACDSCHGADGSGIGPYVPKLAGQHAGYMTEQFARWRRDERRNDPLGSMGWIAGLLTAGEADAVSRHYAAQRPSREPPPKPPQRPGS